MKWTINFKKDKKKEDQKARWLIGEREDRRGSGREVEGKKIRKGEGRRRGDECK